METGEMARNPVCHAWEEFLLQSVSRDAPANKRKQQQQKNTDPQPRKENEIIRKATGSQPERRKRPVAHVLLCVFNCTKSISLENFLSWNKKCVFFVEPSSIKVNWVS